MIIQFPKEVTKPVKVSTVTIRQMSSGFQFEVDGKPVSDVQMARLCVAIAEVIGDRS